MEILRVIRAGAFDFVRKNVSKIVAPFIIAGAGWVAATAGVPMPAELAAVLTDAVSVTAGAAAVAAVGVAERLVARKTNPDNTAK